MGRPDILLRLDQVARRYGCDPGAVLEWDSERFAIACMCADQAMATMAEMQERGAAGMPVIVVGAL